MCCICHVWHMEVLVWLGMREIQRSVGRGLYNCTNPWMGKPSWRKGKQWSSHAKLQTMVRLSSSVKQKSNREYNIISWVLDNTRWMWHSTVGQVDQTAVFWHWYAVCYTCKPFGCSFCSKHKCLVVHIFYFYLYICHDAPSTVRMVWLFGRADHSVLIPLMSLLPDFCTLSSAIP